MNKDPQHIVVGSGPSGVACAAALLKAGCRVLMIDPGYEIEKDKRQAIEDLSKLEPANWPDSTRFKLTSEIRPDSSGLVDKLHFGSDYIYRDADRLMGLNRKNVGIKASLARGGLSNVWGGAMMPTTAYDMSDWPISYADLFPHYLAVSRFVPISARHDGLCERFPLGIEHPLHLQSSLQAEKIVARMDKSRSALEKTGFYHGYSRVAIRGSDSSSDGCNYCGFCMYGCPYGYIYSSSSTIPLLENSGRFEYRPGYLAESVEDAHDSALVSVLNLATGERSLIKGRRAFLAAGPLPTTALLMRLTKTYETPVTMLDSQYFVLPMLMLDRVSNVRTEALHAMSQVFLEFIEPKLGGNSAHLQIYTNSDFLGRFVKLAFGPLARPLDIFIEEIQNRLAVMQAFMHSNDSGRMSVTLRRTLNGDETHVSSNPLPKHTKRAIRTICTRLLMQSFKTGLVPLLPKLEIPDIGRSFHSGGSFPMRLNPSGIATDILGRPPGVSRVHAVDSTVLPSIPGTTITFPTMANAHRIASEAAKL